MMASIFSQYQSISQQACITLMYSCGPYQLLIQIQLGDKLSKKYNHIEGREWSPQSDTILSNELVVRARLSHVVLSVNLIS